MEKLRESATIATKYFYPDLGEYGPSLSEHLVGVPNLIHHIVWERVIGASSLTLGITKSFYLTVDLSCVSVGLEASTSNEAAEKLIADCVSSTTEIMKDITLDP